MKTGIVGIALATIVLTACGAGELLRQAQRPTPGLRHQLERFEGDAEAERRLIEELKNNVTRSQLIKARKSGGRLLRATHAKGICAAAELRVDADLPERLRVGFFDTDPAQPLPARVRFANAASEIKPDGDPDVRAMSISITDGVRRLDFSMNNDPVFTIPSLTAFNLLLEFNVAAGAAIQRAAAAAGRPLSAEQAAPLQKAAMVDVIRKRKLDVGSWAKTLQDIFARGARQTGKPIKSFREYSYWSGTAFKFGQEAAKYALTPCGNAAASAASAIVEPALKNDSFLHDELRSYLRTADNPPVCFDLRVQILDRSNLLLSDEEATELIEDPTIEWDESRLPFEKLGRVLLRQGAVVPDHDCDSRSNAFDSTAYNMEEHQGLGRINRGRGASERISLEKRTAAN